MDLFRDGVRFGTQGQTLSQSKIYRNIQKQYHSIVTSITAYRKTLHAGTTLWFQRFDSPLYINKKF